MKVRNIVRKAAVLGSSAALVGTTLMGALAYDLGTYPAKFVVDGQFDGKIILGENAAMIDMLGAVDIATGLQQAAVKKVPLPGQAGSVSVSGDAFQIGTGSDQLELREALADVADVITGDDLKGLKSGKISTSAGTTEYEQYLRLQNTSSGLQDMAVNYHVNSGEDDEKMADYLVIASSTAPFLEWEIQFTEGLESDWEDQDSTAGGIGDLQDLEDKTFNILGTDYTITSAEINPGGSSFTLELMGGSLAKSLREGESETYNIDGTDYTVALLFVSDPNSGDVEAKFSVNGELTRAMEEGDTETLSGGLQIGVRDILVNSREGVASFYLGANKVVFTDSNANDTSFSTGDIEINDETSESGVFMVSGTWSPTAENEITSMRYQVAMESVEGSTAYIPAGKGVREFMDEPGLLISDSLDIKYAGLTKPETKAVRIRPSGDDQYKLSFTNIQGDEYKEIPLLAASGNLIVWGDEDDSFIFNETLNITKNDYVLVSDDRGTAYDKSVSAVLRYDDFDDDQNVVTFIDQSSKGKISTVVDSVTGEGTLKVNGKSFLVRVRNNATADGPVLMDLNADGTIDGDKVGFTAWGGLYVSWPLSLNLTGETAAGDDGDGARFNGTISADLFDTSGSGAESFTWTVTLADASANEMDLDFEDTNYVGPLDSTNDWDEFDFDELEDDSEKTVGMTDYGVFVTEVDPDTSSDPNELILDVPKTQRFAQVFVTLGETSSTEGEAGTADRINPVDLGIAILDSEADGLVGTENLIVVGGPCANTVAASLMGSTSEDCAAGFEAGKAIIKAWDKGDTVAVLVAGYEAKETQYASGFLAKEAKKLAGKSEATISFNSRTDYQIS